MPNRRKQEKGYKGQLAAWALPEPGPEKENQGLHDMRDQKLREARVGEL